MRADKSIELSVEYAGEMQDIDRALEAMAEMLLSSSKSKVQSPKLKDAHERHEVEREQ